MFEPIPEARLERRDAGLVPERDGWFVVNVADAEAEQTDRFGAYCTFEGSVRFPHFGINVHVLEPGKPNGLYHRETNQEDFLVLSGECIAIVEGEERPLRKGDFLHCPPGTAHILVGAGDGPCAVLMAGRRDPDERLLYPVSEEAGRYGGSAGAETGDARVAYGEKPPPTATTLGIPW